MTKYEMLEAVLDKFKAECDAQNANHSSAYARMCGALMGWADDEVATQIYNYYIVEAN